MDVALYEEFLAFLRSKSLSQSEWGYPSFVRTSEERRADRDKAEHKVLGTKNVGTSGLVVNREILLYKMEVKVGSEMQIQKEIPTQQMVSQELASLHVGFSASAKHITCVRSQVYCLKAAEFFFPRSMGGLQAAVER